VAYSQTLARRVRLALAARSDVAEKPMFGGLTFMVQGNMTCGVAKSKEELMIRLAAETTLASFESPYVRMCDFTKRPMRGLFWSVHKDAPTSEMSISGLDSLQHAL